MQRGGRTRLFFFVEFGHEERNLKALDKVQGLLQPAGLAGSDRLPSGSIIFLSNLTLFSFSVSKNIYDLDFYDLHTASTLGFVPV